MRPGVVHTGDPEHAPHTHVGLGDTPIDTARNECTMSIAPSIGHNQPNWSWDAELICIEQGFRVFAHQEHEDMEMGPLFDVQVAIYFASHP